MDSTTNTEKKPLVDWHERSQGITNLLDALRFVAEARKELTGRQYLGTELWADRVVAIMMAAAAHAAPEAPGALPVLHVHVGERVRANDHAGCVEHAVWYAAPLRDGVELPPSSGFVRVVPELDLRTGKWTVGWVVPGARGRVLRTPVAINGIGYALEVDGPLVGRTELRGEVFAVLQAAGDAFEAAVEGCVHARVAAAELTASSDRSVPVGEDDFESVMQRLAVAVELSREASAAGTVVTRQEYRLEVAGGGTGDPPRL